MTHHLPYDSKETATCLKELALKCEEAARAMWPDIDRVGGDLSRKKLWGRAAAALETAAEDLKHVLVMIESAGELKEQAEAPKEGKTVDPRGGWGPQDNQGFEE